MTTENETSGNESDGDLSGGMTRDRFDGEVERAVKSNPGAVIEAIKDGIEESAEHRDQYLSMVREHLGEVHRDLVKDSLEQFDVVREDMSPSEATNAIKMALAGKTPGMGPKEIRDTKWWIGAPKKHLDSDNPPSTRRGAEAYITLSRAWRQHKAVTKDFWKDVQRHADELGFKWVESEVQKTLQAGTLQDGGALLAQRMADEIISFLYANTVLPSLGARTIDISDGGIDFGDHTSSAAAYWLGELEEATASSQEFGKRGLQPHKLGVLVILSNELLERSPAGFEQLIQDDISEVSELEMDRAGLFGDGNGAEPKGLYEQTDSNNIFTRQNTGSAATIAEIHQDLMKAINKVDTNKIDTDGDTAGWALHPRTVNALMAQVTSDDKIAFFAEQLTAGNLQGRPYETTTQFPTGLNESGQNSNDETRILFGVFNQFLIGQSDDVGITRAESGQVTDAQGNTINLLTQDATGMVTFSKTDFLARRPKAFSWVQGVDYAPDVNF